VRFLIIQTDFDATKGLLDKHFPGNTKAICHTSDGENAFVHVCCNSQSVRIIFNMTNNKDERICKNKLTILFPMVRDSMSADSKVAYMMSGSRIDENKDNNPNQDQKVLVSEHNKKMLGLHIDEAIKKATELFNLSTEQVTSLEVLVKKATFAWSSKLQVNQVAVTCGYILNVQSGSDMTLSTVADMLKISLFTFVPLYTRISHQVRIKIGTTDIFPVWIHKLFETLAPKLVDLADVEEAREETLRFARMICKRPFQRSYTWPEVTAATFKLVVDLRQDVPIDIEELAKTISRPSSTLEACYREVHKKNQYLGDAESVFKIPKKVLKRKREESQEKNKIQKVNDGPIQIVRDKEEKQVTDIQLLFVLKQHLALLDLKIKEEEEKLQKSSSQIMKATVSERIKELKGDVEIFTKRLLYITQ
jgi:hypothetical protein